MLPLPCAVRGVEDGRGLGLDFAVVSTLVPPVEKFPGGGNAASGAMAIASASSSIMAGGGKYSVLAFGGGACAQIKHGV